MDDYVWIVYYQDMSDVAVFFEEIEALRYAVGKSGVDVIQAGAGSIKEQIAQPREFNKPNEENNNGNEASSTPSRRERQRQHKQGSPAPSINDTPEPTNEEGFTADQLEAQRRIKASEENGPQDVGSFVRGR